MTWLYDDHQDLAFELVPQGQPFADAELSRDAVAEALMQVITGELEIPWKASYGIGKPHTHFDKPRFY